MAAGRTVDAERRVHSMHAYFLKLGRPQDPDRLRRRPHPRRSQLHHPPRRRDPARSGHLQPGRVVPRPRGRAPSTTTACPRSRRRDVPGGPPARLAEDGPETIDRQGAPHVIDALDFRHVGDRWNPGPNRARRCAIPTRTPGSAPRPSARRLRCCTRAWSRTPPTSRCSAPRRCRIPLGDDDPGFMMASLDHVMWFHRPFRADEWLLYHVHSPSAGMARGLRDRVRSSAPTARWR